MEDWSVQGGAAYDSGGGGHESRGVAEAGGVGGVGAGGGGIADRSPCGGQPGGLDARCAEEWSVRLAYRDLSIASPDIEAGEHLGGESTRLPQLTRGLCVREASWVAGIWLLIGSWVAGGDSGGVVVI